MKILKLPPNSITYAALVAIASNLVSINSVAAVAKSGDIILIAQNPEIREVQVETITETSQPQTTGTSAQPSNNSDNSESSVIPINVPKPPLLMVEGALERGDQVIPTDGSFYDAYNIQGKAGQEIKVELESQDFDTYLAITDAKGKIIAENDDITPDNSNSAITLTFPSDGIYRLIVNSYSEQGQGKYKIQANSLSEDVTNTDNLAEKKNPR